MLINKRIETKFLRFQTDSVRAESVSGFYAANFLKQLHNQNRNKGINIDNHHQYH